MFTAADYERAERELTLREWRTGWKIHVTIYALVMVGLTVLNLVLVANTDADFLWFPFPLIGWGIGVTMHYLHGVRWAERDIRARQEKIEEIASRTSESI
jgi:hypothetical protein